MAFTKPKVYITKQLFKPAIDLLKKSSSVEVFEGDDDPVPREILLKKVGKVDGLVCLITERIDKEVLEMGKKLKVISNYAVGSTTRCGRGIEAWDLCHKHAGNTR
jgi:glyoxylate reductase